MQLIQNGTQVTSLPAPATAVGTPGYGNNTPPGPDVTPTVWDSDTANAVIAEIANAITASGQTVTPGTFTQLTAAIKGLPLGRLLNIQSLSSNGTFAATTGATGSLVFGQGGGGGSAGSPATGASQVSLSGGGGGGAFGIGFYTSGVNGAVVTIGAAGTAGAAGSNNGGNGGATSLGSVMTCPGGLGGNAGGAGSIPSSTTLSTTAAGAPSGANLLASAGSFPSVGVWTTVGGSPAVSNGGPGFWGVGGPGSGGQGIAVAFSSAAAAGNAGKAGNILVFEFS